VNYFAFLYIPRPLFIHSFDLIGLKPSYVHTETRRCKSQ